MDAPQLDACGAPYRYRVNKANSHCFSCRKQGAFIAPRIVDWAAPKGREFGTFDP
jgi:hypothetical protein